MLNLFSIYFFLFFTSISVCATPVLKPLFHSKSGQENIVSYTATYKSLFRSLEETTILTQLQKKHFKQTKITPLTSYLFGPSVRRAIGAPRSSLSVDIDWNSAYLKNGYVYIDYEVTGPWLLKKEFVHNDFFYLPIPLNQKDLFTEMWKNCSDRDPAHQTRSFFWYFWDPQRYGCDHKEMAHYKEVQLNIGGKTLNQQETYPEYQKLIDKDNNLKMTIAFGYIDTPTVAFPETDSDGGMREYRNFLNYVQIHYPFFTKTPILQSDFLGHEGSGTVTGYLFEGVVNSAKIFLKVLASGDVDQMEVFSKSFTHDKDGFFAWFGHSRLGSGFDANQLKWRLQSNPNYYSISKNYQLLYWGGCNGYSYYTLPFFNFKSQALGPIDPNGTKNLDIISYGLPSYFSFNSLNAQVILNNLMNWQNRPSYQKIVEELEYSASLRMSFSPLVAVLGDEDNTYD